MGGRQIIVDLLCAVCHHERRVLLGDTEGQSAVFNVNGFRYPMLHEVTCGDRSCAPHSKVCEFLPISSRGHAASGMLRQSNGSRDEVSGDSRLDESDDVEVIGFLAVVKQFYKA